MLIRRQLMAMQKQREAIGYSVGFRLNWDSTLNTMTEYPDADYFVTGFIPYTATNATIKLTGKYSSKGFVAVYTHFIAFYDANKISIRNTAYYDMTTADVRSVTNTANWLVRATAYIRFVGRVDSIDDCFIKDDMTGNILWKKGM